MLGQSIAHYRVTAKLGAGGMGEVYRASDTKLGREVALKVLPAAFASDAERMKRFEREAQVLASLNHPNIAAIYGLEHQEKIQALAMELVEGPTLAERITQGAVPLAEALPIAKQIAEALEYAHERGVVHRDLKPANIKLTLDGKVKLLDFGLAKALTEDVSAAGSTSLDFSPTLSVAATKAGIILGTAAYMSPEQARGKPVDRRADIWSYGLVLFEMLAGRRAFSGEDATETLAAVIKSEPNWEALPAETPVQIRKLLRRCVEKDRQRRLQAIGEARIQIEEVQADSSATTAVMSAVTTAPAPMWKRALPWVVAGVMTLAFVAALAMILRSPAAPEPAVSRFEIDMGTMTLMPNAPGARITISPDGRKIVVSAVRAGAAGSQLFLRNLENLDFVLLPGTEDATQPFFSPDGQWVAFFAGGKLKKVSVAGGLPITLCDVSGLLTTGTWGDDGTILINGRGELSRIPDGGGTPEKITVQDPWKTEGPRWMSILPGSHGVLLVFAGVNQFNIEVLSLETGKHENVVQGGSWPRYLSTGHLVYAQYSSGSEAAGFTGSLLAVPFDLKKLARTGPPVPVLGGVRVGSGGAGYYDVAANGTLVYAPGAGGRTVRKNLSWASGKGKAEKLSFPPHHYDDLHISPDGSRVALTMSDAAPDVYVCDLRRGTLQRLTFEAINSYPVFTPDGSHVVYSSNSGTGTAPNLWSKPADGSGTAERLATSEYAQVAPAISPDGKTIAFMEIHMDTSTDIYVLPMEGDRKPRPFVNTKFFEGTPDFSPDGKWIAYVSNESGNFEVYVQPFPGPGGKWQISTGGGTFPVWSRNGKQLYYVSGRDKLMAVDVVRQPTFHPGTPRVVLEGFELTERTNRNYDVAADGRILFAPLIEQPQEQQNVLRVVENFFTDIRHRTQSEKKQ